MTWRIVFKKSVAKDLRRIPQADVRRILATINTLAENPRVAGTEKLSGSERYRIRQGMYRILYEVKDEEILIIVVKVGHRRDVYR
jgi:mRNA interferase RelE/StbE